MLKSLLKFPVLFLLISNVMYSQIGVNTTTPDPSTALDVNGTTRVRTLSNGAVYSNANGDLNNNGPQTIAAGLIQGNGTAIKISGATVSRINEGDYQVTFNTPRPTTTYIINLATIDCGGNCNGSANTYDDPGITYYQRQAAGFRINIGDSDNGATQKDDIDIEFTFSVIDF